MALPSDIIQKINELERRIRTMESHPQPPNINLDETVEATFTVSANDWVLVTLTLTDDNNSRLMAQPNFSLYRSATTTSINLYPTGANWTYAEVMGLRLQSWLDWGGSDNNNVVMKLLLVNGTANPISNIHFVANFRFLTKGVSVG
jgi:hypothetical protein